MRAADGEVRAHFRPLAEWLAETPAERVAEKRREADLLFHRVGITFAVYGDNAGAERLIPFDTIPRIIPSAEWDELARGLRQRVARSTGSCTTSTTSQEILKAGVIPAEQVLTNEAYQVAMLGLDLPNHVYSTSPASTSCATTTASTTCSRTTCARPRACRTCSRTAG